MTFDMTEGRNVHFYCADSSYVFKKELTGELILQPVFYSLADTLFYGSHNLQDEEGKKVDNCAETLPSKICYDFDKAVSRIYHTRRISTRFKV